MSVPWPEMVLAFLLGSLPFGAWVARLKGVDITKVGSGNIGATNVHRVLGLGPGLAVLALDILKGLVPAAYGATQEGVALGLALGVCAMAGHCFSPFLRFRGGKGIATGLGLLLGADPVVALVALGVFVAAVATSRMISVGSILASLSLCATGLVLGRPTSVLVLYLAMGLFAVHRHRANLARIRAGTEPRFRLRPSSRKTG
ncbi:MAG: glycerol-3-phosphate 1-O-acyltransferase PlsY [Fimbriimonadales bacterium]|nr:glycerol-3-phosphate 1-O-acyltransferase PlsY [Fimbriimonadales bacterium]